MEVRHRIDGLENTAATKAAFGIVRHRIDGLETTGHRRYDRNKGSPSHRWFRNQD